MFWRRMRNTRQAVDFEKTKLISAWPAAGVVWPAAAASGLQSLAASGTCSDTRGGISTRICTAIVGKWAQGKNVSKSLPLRLEF